MAVISGRRRWAVPQVIRPLLPPRLHRITSCQIIQAHCRPRHMEVSIAQFQLAAATSYYVLSNLMLLSVM